MLSRSPTNTSIRRQRTAFTLIETVVATGIVGVMLVAALNTVGAARVTEYKTAERGRALLLAQDLMAEIVQQAYADSVGGAGSFGLDDNEAFGSGRDEYDDVDDYDGWVAKPPQERDGTDIPDTSEYERSVTVEWVAGDDVTEVRGSNTGVKLITLTVSHQGREIITLRAYRTQAWTSPVELWGAK